MQLNMGNGNIRRSVIALFVEKSSRLHIALEIKRVLHSVGIFYQAFLYGNPIVQNKLKRINYGWGIVGRSGKPWWDEACVCEDRGPLLETVANLNDDSWARGGVTGDHPYRVVRLFYETRKKP